MNLAGISDVPTGRAADLLELRGMLYREDLPGGAFGSIRALLRSGPGVLAAKARRHSFEQMITAGCCWSMAPGLGWRLTLKCSHGRRSSS